MSTEAEQQARRESSELTPIRSIHHLDRKLSATSRIPKRSTIIESSAGSIAYTAMSSSQRSTEIQRPQIQAPPAQQPRGPPIPPQRQQSLQAVSLPASLQSPALLGQPSYSTSLASQASPYATQPQPTFLQTTNQVHDVDHPVPQPPHSPPFILPPDRGAEDGITLADIPQFIEATQNKSLPNVHDRPHIAELSPLELLLVKYAALLILAKSPLGDPALVEEMIEFLEAKKGGFWNKLFNKGDKKIKKKG